jgi:ABC-2 type transport system ATP-binding protein
LTPAIEVSGIRKTFFKKRSLGELIRHPFGRAEPIHALRGVDMRVGEGEIFGLLGPNGAGKTTLLKILSCLVLPDEGEARVRGIEVEQENRVKPLIGLVHADERSFYWRLSARENLRFFARLYNLDGRRIAQRIQELLERVDMTEAADRPFSGYSSGMKQRVAIARALLHDPPILFMDEPTRSLDPVAALALRNFVLDELKHEHGKTILLATHNLQEAEMMADRLAVLVKGKVRESGTVEQVRRWGLGQERFVIETDPGQETIEGPFRIVDDESHDGRRRMILTLEAGADFEDMMRALMAAGIGLHSCEREQADLESAFERILGAGEDGG